jgi:hypothetical protein
MPYVASSLVLSSRRQLIVEVSISHLPPSIFLKRVPCRTAGRFAEGEKILPTLLTTNRAQKKRP